MGLIVALYLGLALAYLDAVLQSIFLTKWRDASREAVIVCLYICIAVMVWDPAWMQDLVESL